MNILNLVQPWHIQNSEYNQRHSQDPGLFRAPWDISESKAYSEPCQTSTMERFEKQLTAIIIFESYYCFCNISFSCPLVNEINTIFLIQI